MRALILIIPILVFVLGCGSSTRREVDWSPSEENVQTFLRAQNLIVICTQGDEDAQLRVEKIVGAKLRVAGLQAHERKLVLAVPDTLSYAELRSRLKTMGFTGIVQVSYPQATLPGEPPKELRVQFETLSRTGLQSTMQGPQIAPSIVVFLLSLLRR